MSNLKTKKARKRAERAESIRLEFMKNCVLEAGKASKNPQELPKLPQFLDVETARKQRRDRALAGFGEVSKVSAKTPVKSVSGQIPNRYIFRGLKKGKSTIRGEVRKETFLKETKQVSRPASYKSGKVKSYVGEMPTKRERAEQMAYFGLTDKPKTGKTDALLVARAAEPRHLNPLPEALPTVNSDVRPAKAKLGQKMEYMGVTYVLAKRNNRLGWVRLLTDSKGNTFNGRQIELPYEQNDEQNAH